MPGFPFDDYPEPLTSEAGIQTSPAPFDLWMFPCRVTIEPILPEGTSNETGETVDAFADAIEDVPCFIEPAGEEAKQAAAAQGYRVDKNVFFRTDPGDLATGTRLIVTSIDGQEPTRPMTLIVERIEFDILPYIKIWRADCTGRA